jgi:hypothetical protein
VLLGDPPVDWNAVETIRDLDKWGSRDTHAVNVIRKEVLAGNRRALLIYGDDHFARKNRGLTGDDWASNIVGQLEQAGLARVFVIHSETRLDLVTLQSDVGSWPIPSLAILNGTVLGAAEFEPTPRLRPRRTEELFDAVLYLGPSSRITFAQLRPERCADPAYMDMRLRRLALLPGPPPQAPPGTVGPLEGLRAYCRSVGR